MNTARSLYNGGSGAQTAALAAAGDGPAGSDSNLTESFNGTTWNAVANLTTGRRGVGAAQTSPSSASAVFGGRVSSTDQTITEEWNFGVYSYSAAAWASGGNLNTARQELTGFGTQTASLATGGYTTNFTAATELYNGTSWTSNPTGLNTPRSGLASASSSPQTAGLVFGGSGPTPTTGATESWNGSIFTSTPNSMNTARFYLTGSGTQTAALAFGGRTPPTFVMTDSESWNGTSWTATPTLNTARNSAIGFGIQTASIATTGRLGPASPFATSTATESWNGSSWTSVNSTNTSRQAGGGSGVQTAGIIFGGYNTASTGATELWNGTSWSNLPSMSTARQFLTGEGTQTAALAAGGTDTAVFANTEEWTGEIATANSKTLTTS
jgi:hypothetical protein